MCNYAEKFHADYDNLYFFVKWSNIYASLLDGKGSELTNLWTVVPLSLFIQ